MIIKTYTSDFGIYYHYFSDDNIKHGIYNFKNRVIGYCYQNKQKGFWLEKLKI